MPKSKASPPGDTGLVTTFSHTELPPGQSEISIEFSPVEADPRERLSIRAGDLVVDQNLQRPVERRRVERIASEWDWRLVETLTVTRSKGRYKVIEGQYRTLAAQLRDPDTLLPCIVIDSVAEADQAMLALTISTGRKPMVSVDRFRQRLGAGDPSIAAVQATLEKFDLRIGASPSSKTIIAAQAIMAVVDEAENVDRGADVLDRVLMTLTSAYREGEASGKERWRAPLITALAMLVERNYDLFDHEEMAERIAEHPAIYWLNLAKATRAKRPEDVVASALIDAYNRGKRQNRRLV